MALSSPIGIINPNFPGKVFMELPKSHFGEYLNEMTKVWGEEFQ